MDNSNDGACEGGYSIFKRTLEAEVANGMRTAQGACEYAGGKWIPNVDQLPDLAGQWKASAPPQNDADLARKYEASTIQYSSENIQKIIEQGPENVSPKILGSALHNINQQLMKAQVTGHLDMKPDELAAAQQIKEFIVSRGGEIDDLKQEAGYTRRGEFDTFKRRLDEIPETNNAAAPQPPQPSQPPPGGFG